MNLNRIDWQILGTALIISLLGSVALLSTTVNTTGGLEFGGIFVKQIGFIFVGVLIYFLASKFDFTYFKFPQISGAFYVVILVLLLVTILFAPSINSAKRWLIIAGVQIQPSEFAKIAVIFSTAVILQMKNPANIWARVGISFLLALLYALLIYWQPHTTMTGLVLIMWFLTVFTMLPYQFRNTLILIEIVSAILGIMLIILGFQLWGIVLVILSVVIVIFGSFSEFKEKKIFVLVFIPCLIFGIIGPILFQYVPQFQHQRDRIEAFFYPDENLEGKAFNINQAKIAIGSGQIWGKGFGFGTQSKLNYLPEHQTDFLFAAYAEEFGLVGTLGLMTLYAWLLLRIFNISIKVKDTFSSTVIVLLGIKILSEVFINIGTNTGTIPATGIPLPLFSAGGTITLATFFSLGIIQSIISNSQDIIDSEEIIN